MACPRIETCPMYARFKLKVLLGVWKMQYCERDFETCERYKLVQLGQTAPDDLLPDGASLHAR